jgi:hypothetical protein
MVGWQTSCTTQNNECLIITALVNKPSMNRMVTERHLDTLLDRLVGEKPTEVRMA